MTIRRPLVIALALALTGGCAGEDGASTATTAASAGPDTAADTAASTTTSTTTSPATTTTTPATTTVAPAPSTSQPDIDEQLTELARSALIDLSVLPEGWIETPDEQVDGDAVDDFGDEVDTCLGRDGQRTSDALDGREARSGDFRGPGDTRQSVQHEVKLADDEAMAIEVMDDVAVEGAADCLASTLQAYLEAEAAADIEQDGLELGSVAVTRVEVVAPADERVAYRVDIPLVLAGQTFVQHLHVLYQRQGRALSQLQFGSFDVPFEPERYDAIADAVDGRLLAVDR